MKKTKPWCQKCGNGFADENFMLGRCCGLPMIEIEIPKEELELEEAARKRILARAAKLKW